MKLTGSWRVYLASREKNQNRGTSEVEDFIMTNLKKIFIAGSAILTLGVGTAANAQPWNGGDRAHQQDRRDDRGSQQSARDDHLTPDYIKSLDSRIMREAHAGHISWTEAGRLRGDERLALQVAVKRRHAQIAPWEYERLVRSVRNIEVSTSRYADNNDHRYGGHDAYRR
jgi:hypothetical protein